MNCFASQIDFHLVLLQATGVSLALNSICSINQAISHIALCLAGESALQGWLSSFSLIKFQLLKFCSFLVSLLLSCCVSGWGTSGAMFNVPFLLGSYIMYSQGTVHYFLFLADVADRFDLLRQFCVIHWFPYWTGISLCTGLESDFAASCISTFLSTLQASPK